MRIVHLTGYYPPHLGGMELRTKEMAEYFAKKGHSVDVITSDIDCKENKLISSRNLQIQYLKSIEFAHTPIMFSLFWKLMRINKESIIHLHVSQAILPELTYLVSIIRRIPYIAHIHLDVEQSGFFGRFLPIYKKIFLAPVLKKADAITVLTEDYKKIIIEKYNLNKDKIFVIPNGTYFKIHKFQNKDLHKPIRLLFVGRLSVQKNVQLLLHALSILIKEKKLNVHLTLAGDGEKKEELQKLVDRLHLGRNVAFLGRVEFDKLQQTYANADIFVLPSVSESFGSVVIEAMASGVPVVASNIPALRNIIKDKKNGILASLDKNSFADAIELLISDSKLRNSIAQNAVKEIKKFSWVTVASQYEELYFKILKSKTI